MSLLQHILTRQQCRQASSLFTSIRTAGGFTMTPSPSSTFHNKEFWSKNKQLHRPISPHLSVYKPQLTTTLSILHRITGVGTSVILYGAGIGTLAFSGQSFPEMVQLLQDNVPHIFIQGTKAVIGGSLIYHTLTGIRHLIWDAGYGFQLKHLYISGYFVVILSAIGTVMLFIRG